jgi:sensor histidine kinase regulating citrate/malate metabolism
MKWLEPLTENVNAPLRYPQCEFTGHSLPDAVLSRYMELAKAAGIDITVRIFGELKTDMTELAVVLANALENAVKACKLLADNRVIKVDGQPRGTQYFLEIANTYAGEVTIDPDSGLPSGPAADDGKEHGLGTQSIAFFAHKHGAVLQYQVENGWFRVRLLI